MHKHINVKKDPKMNNRSVELQKVNHLAFLPCIRFPNCKYEFSAASEALMGEFLPLVVV